MKMMCIHVHARSVSMYPKKLRYIQKKKENKKKECGKEWREREIKG